MTTETLKLHHIANNLPFGLKVKSTTHRRIDTLIGLDKAHKGRDRCYLKTSTDCTYLSSFEKVKPIMHHISSLTKPVRLKGYDEPVVPIVELAKIAYENEDFEPSESYKDIAISSRFEFEFIADSFRCYNYITDCTVTVPNQWKLFAKLDEWFFNYRGIPDNLVEYINDEFNPYI